MTSTKHAGLAEFVTQGLRRRTRVVLDQLQQLDCNVKPALVLEHIKWDETQQVVAAATVARTQLTKHDMSIAHGWAWHVEMESVSITSIRWHL